MGDVRNPTPDDLERGTRYILEIDWTPAATVSILTAPDFESTNWQCQSAPLRSAHSVFNLVQTSDLVVRDSDAREELRVRRHSRIPPRFDMVQGGEVVGTIRLRSLLRNRYSMNLAGGPTWNVHMPLFTTYFYAESNADSRLWINVWPSKRQWNVLMQAGADDLRLLAGIAFIHRQWWCYS
jgi:hypothetical protein